MDRRSSGIPRSSTSSSDGEITITVGAECDGQRLDAFLAARIDGESRARIQRAIAGGDIVVNDRLAKSSYRVRPGDTIEVDLPEALPIEALPEDIPLEIVFEDDQVAVINKPAGMVVHPGAGVSSGTLANALVHHFNQLSQIQGRARPGIVHRLDVGTSGLIVVAKTERAHLALAAQFERRAVLKRYLALVHGRISADAGRIDAPIGRDPRNRVKMAVRKKGEGREALTLYRVRERFTAFSLLEAEIKTGRTHQIRVHLAHAKHPIVGDATYGQGALNTMQNSRLRAAATRLGRPFLHSARLKFEHPVSGEEMEFCAPLPADLEEYLELVRSSD
jgi:23S rRNA pseudouridine1911/1915/1917 synthase